MGGKREHRRAEAEPDRPDPRRVETNRVRFLEWLAGAHGENVRGSDFDVPDVPPPTIEHMPCPPYWWGLRGHAIPAYCARVLKGSTATLTGGKAIVPATVYLLALELLETSKRRTRAMGFLRKIEHLERLPEGVRSVVGRVRAGDLQPDRVWIGPLEWALLEEAGVRWPQYPIALADLGDDRTDEVEREVARRLRDALLGFAPLVQGESLATEALLRWYYWTVQPEKMARRAFLLDAARQAVGAPDRTAHQRRSAMLAVLGLALLGYGGIWTDTQTQALRAVEQAKEAHGPGAALATRLLRHPADACYREAKDEFWACVGAVVDEPEPVPAPAVAAPAAIASPQASSHDEDFASVTIKGTAYVFTTQRQRDAVEMLWKANGKPVGEDSILKAIDPVKAERGDNHRLRDVFKVKGNQTHPAWNTAIRPYRARSRLYVLDR